MIIEAESIEELENLVAIHRRRIAKEEQEVTYQTEDDKIILDPETATPFEQVMINMIRTHRKKAKDYSGKDWWSQNFWDSAYQTNTTPGTSIEVLIATKQARLRTLFKPGAVPQNEGIEDTLLDRAVYAAMSYALWDEGGYEAGAAQQTTVRVDQMIDITDKVLVDADKVPNGVLSENAFGDEGW